MPFTVIYDACVLYPFHLRDLLIRVAQAGLVHARWSEAILREWYDALVEDRPELAVRLVRTKMLMNDAIRDVLIEDYEALIPGLDLPDPNDRHVLAAAIKSGAQVIVTHNLRDFPPAAIERYGIEAQHPDAFVLNLIDLNASAVAEAIVAMELDLASRPGIPYVLAALERADLKDSVEVLKSLFEEK